MINSLNPEALEAALIFWRDFEKSAINLPTEQRKQFVKLSSEISILGRQFLKQTNAARPPVLIQASELHGMKDSNMGAQLHSQAEHTLRALKIYPGSLQAHMIMRSVPAESPRQKVYVATNTSSSEQLDILERLLKTRARLARLAGKDSYAAITLTNKMAKSPGEQCIPVHDLPSKLMHWATFRQCTALFRCAIRIYPSASQECIANSCYPETDSLVSF